MIKLEQIVHRDPDILGDAGIPRYTGALITIDRSIEFQQRISRLPFSIALVRARSNRLEARGAVCSGA